MYHFFLVFISAFLLSSLGLFLLVLVLKPNLPWPVVMARSFVLGLVFTLTGIVGTKFGIPGESIGWAINLGMVMGLLGFRLYGAFYFSLMASLFYINCLYPFLMTLF